MRRMCIIVNLSDIDMCLKSIYDDSKFALDIYTQRICRHNTCADLVCIWLTDKTEQFVCLSLL